MALSFINDGELDIRSATTFGVSVKESATPIGFFGTGFKYAVAIILRNRGRILLHTGGKRYEFISKTETIRGEEFSIVYLVEFLESGELQETPLGFTTEVGKTWAPWMAMRELYCNCIDEGGTVSEISDPAYTGQIELGDASKTEVIVLCHEVQIAWEARHSYFIPPSRKQIASTPHIQAFEGDSTSIFYRGIMAMDIGMPSVFTWNVTSLQTLTEDRTLRATWMPRHYAGKLVATSNDPLFIERVLVCPQGTFEGSLDFTGEEVSDQFYASVCKLRQHGSLVNQTAFFACASRFISDLIERDPAQLDTTDQQRLDAAIDFCVLSGFPVNKFPIVVLESMEGGVLGRAINGKIVISKRGFALGKKVLAATLIEEYAHLEHGFNDESREFQNWLLQELVSQAERSVGIAL